MIRRECACDLCGYETSEEIADRDFGKVALVRVRGHGYEWRDVCENCWAKYIAPIVEIIEKRAAQ